MIDYHVHTSFCNHAAGTMEQPVRAAGGKGLATICFPDHLTLQEAGRTDRVCPKYPGMLESMLDYEYFDVVCNSTRSY